MKEFVITEKGVFADGLELEVGTRVKHEYLPAGLVNKAKEVESVGEKTLEVATPRRGRPPKDQS
jgi:hypothetical protein